MLDNLILKSDTLISSIEPFTLDIIITVLVATFTIILAIGEDVKNKYYQKKYLLTCYLLLYVFSNVLDSNFISILLFFMVLILPLSALNLSYSNNKNNFLEQELSVLQYWTYHILYWIFIVKMYILFLCILMINLTSNTYIKTLIILLFALYHLYQNSKDLLGVQPFSNTRDRIVKQMNEFNKYSNKPGVNIDALHDLLSFIVYAEDRGYFKRQKPTSNLKLLFEQKYDIPFNFLNLIKKTVSILNDSSSFRNESVKRKTKTQSSLEIIKLIFKRYFRGYSTIEMQHIRVIVMNPNSFDYVIRRKLFVEGVYTYFYFCSWKRFISRVKGKNYDIEDITTYLKIVTLKSYYMDKSILNNPIDYDELVNNFSSRLGSKDYEFLNMVYEREREKYNSQLLVSIEIADSVYNTNRA